MTIELDNIYNCDCIEGLKCIKNGTIDLVCSDPPYGISYKTNRRIEDHKFKHEILNDDNFDLIGSYIRECYRILKDDTAAYFFCSAKTLSFFLNECEKAGFTIKNTIIWDKGNWTAGDLEAQYGQSYEPLIYCNKGRRKINGKRLPDIWRFPRVSADALVHQNQKPLNIIRQCILNSSEQGEVVFDGFMGSGTTAVAAIREKRHYLGFELDSEYYKVAMRRVNDEYSQPSLF